MTTKTDTGIWSLGTAMKYGEQRGGTFSPPAPQSSHTFGWDRRVRAFVVQESLGMGVRNRRHLHVPVELAELFLTRCREDRAFNETFLTASHPNEEAREQLGLDGVVLTLYRGKAELVDGGSRYTSSSLSIGLALNGEQAETLVLFDGLRQIFGKYISSLSAEQVRAGLELQAA
jgi:hypothetical protein